MKANKEIKYKGLLFLAVRKFVVGVAILGAFLFLCGGSLRYWNAWLYIAAFSISIFFFGVYLYTTDKELLQKRLNSKEKEEAQKVYNVAASISLAATFGISGLDFRFGWSHVSLVGVIIALAFMLAGYGLFVLTMLYNRFASRTIEVQSGQIVIETGVYAVIRHPLYTAALVMFFSSPVVLGSYYAVIPVLVFLIGIILRVKNEEAFLSNGLDGYSDYMKKVKYRLIPFVW